MHPDPVRGTLIDRPKPKRHRLFLFGGLFLSFVASIAIAVIIGVVVNRALAPNWNPLIFPTPHAVTSGSTIVLANGVPSQPSVTITAYRCNTSPEQISYKAVKSWISISSPGNAVLVSTAIETQPAGCVTNVSQQPIPDEVISRSTALLVSTGKPVIWEVQAIDTPLHHIHSVAVTWTSTPITFKVAP